MLDIASAGNRIRILAFLPSREITEDILDFQDNLRTSSFDSYLLSGSANLFARFLSLRQSLDRLAADLLVVENFCISTKSFEPSPSPPPTLPPFHSLKKKKLD